MITVKKCKDSLLLPTGPRLPTIPLPHSMDSCCADTFMAAGKNAEPVGFGTVSPGRHKTPAHGCLTPLGTMPPALQALQDRLPLSGEQSLHRPEQQQLGRSHDSGSVQSDHIFPCQACKPAPATGLPEVLGQHKCRCWPASRDKEVASSLERSPSEP